jgi:hypothetical protein
MTCNLLINSLSVYLVGKYLKNKQKITASSAHMVNFDRKQTYIALIMSTVSLLEHILYIISYILFFSDYNLPALVYVLAFLFMAIKHSLVFFVLLGLNNLFRDGVKHFFKRTIL